MLINKELFLLNLIYYLIYTDVVLSQKLPNQLSTSYLILAHSMKLKQKKLHKMASIDKMQLTWQK